MDFHFRVVLVTILASGLACAGCSGSSRPATPGATCSINSGCASGLTCSFGGCQTTCKKASDCPTGLQCVRDVIGLTSCLLPALEACSDNGQCAVPLVCAADLKCRNGCVTDSDCATSTQKCVLPAGVCAEPDAISGGGTLIGSVVDAGAPDVVSATDAAPVVPDVAADSSAVERDALAVDSMIDAAILSPDVADVATAALDSETDDGGIADSADSGELDVALAEAGGSQGS